MSVQNSIWRNFFSGSALPLLFSTVFHTSIFLVLAMSITKDQVASHSMIRASFDEQSVESIELGYPAHFSSQLGDGFGDRWDSGIAETDSPAPDLIEWNEPETGLALVSFRQSFESPKAPNEVDQKAQPEKHGKRSVQKVYTSANTASSDSTPFRFGGARLAGARHSGFGPASTLEVIVPDLDPLGSNVLSQASSLSLTGGAMLVGTAKPDPSIANLRLALSYENSNEDGGRLLVRAGERSSTLAIYDWELKPLAEFVDSGHHGAVSIKMFGRHEKISLDAAFEQRLLGLRFIQADFMPRGVIMSQEYLPQNGHGIVVGPGEEERLSSDRDVAAAVRELRPLMERTRNGATYSVLTDANVPFVFSIEGKELVISGVPYYFFWEPANNGDQVVPKQTLNTALKKAWPQLKQANPLVIESMERCFRAVAFFRFQKQNSPENWKALMGQLNAVSLPQVPTPSLLSAD